MGDDWQVVKLGLETGLSCCDYECNSLGEDACKDGLAALGRIAEEHRKLQDAYARTCDWLNVCECQLDDAVLNTAEEDDDGT